MYIMHFLKFKEMEKKWVKEDIDKLSRRDYQR